LSIRRPRRQAAASVENALAGLDAADFGYRRRGALVLRGLTLTVDHRATVIIGPNGAGKSTVLRLLARQLTPTGGQVIESVSIGYSPQRPVTLAAFTAREQVEYAGWLGGLSRRASAPAALAAIRMVGLEPLAGRPATALSGGEAAKLGIACALVTSPRLLLLDEPTAALDPIARSSVTAVLRQLVADGVTVVATSHTAADVGAPFERLVMMNHGRIEFDGTPADFLSGVHSSPTATELARALRGY
jgi:ABC-2 type transport system ATP-binding protein